LPAREIGTLLVTLSLLAGVPVLVSASRPLHVSAFVSCFPVSSTNTTQEAIRVVVGSTGDGRYVVDLVGRGESFVPPEDENDDDKGDDAGRLV